MMNSINEILFLVARDFVQLKPLQQINIGIKLELVGVEVATYLDHTVIAETIFTKAYQKNKIPELVKEMRNYLYE
jgi:hypothetical protein